MKKLTLLFAALVLSFTAQAAIINGTPNPGEKGRLNWWVNGVVESTPVTQPGDTIVLADGEYEEGSIKFNKEGLVVMAAEGAKPVIKASSYMQHYATTTFIGITFDGQNTAEYATYSYENTAKDLKFVNCEFMNYTQYTISASSSAHVDSLIFENCVLDGSQSTLYAIYAKGTTNKIRVTGTEIKDYKEHGIKLSDAACVDALIVTNSLIHDCAYTAIQIPAAADGKEKQSCSSFELTNSTIYNIGDNTKDYGAIDIRDNANIASTQQVLIDHVTLYNFTTNAWYGGFMVYKSANATISNCIAANPNDIYSKYCNPFHAYTGAEITNSLYFNCEYNADHGATASESLVKADPMFVDAANGDFMLYAESPAIGMGDPRWGVKAGIQPGEGKLKDAVEAAQPGDVIVLGDETYEVSSSISCDAEGLTIKAAEGTNPIISFTGNWSSLKLSATTTFEGIIFDGGNVVNYPITTEGENTGIFTFNNCVFKNYLYYAISNNNATTQTNINSIIVNNCTFHDGGSAIYMNDQAACANITIQNTTIYNIQGTDKYKAAIHVNANATDATFATQTLLDHLTIYNIQTSSSVGAITIENANETTISNCIIASPEQKSIDSYNVPADATIQNCLVHNQHLDDVWNSIITKADPLFVDAANANFMLSANSPAVGAGTDGSNLGDPRWGVSASLKGKVINIEPGEQTLAVAVGYSVSPGDTIVLKDGTYEEPYSFNFDVEGLVVMAAEGAKAEIILTDEGGNANLKLDNSTTFDGITFSGSNISKYLIITNGTDASKFIFNNCEFKNYLNYAISDPWTDKYENGRHVDSILINNCLFHDGGAAINLSKYGPEGKHTCDYFEMKNSTIYNISNTGNAAILVSSNAENTGLQNKVVLDHITIYNYANASYGAIAIRKSSDLQITNSIIANPTSGLYAFYIYGGTINNTLYYNATYDSDATYTACITEDPLFVDAANNNFKLKGNSPAIGKATDGSNLGDPRWGVETIVIGEGDNTAALATQGTALVQVNREFSADKLYTLALPFTLTDVVSIFGQGTIVYEYDKLLEQNGEVVLHFKEVNTISAGKPYLLKPAQNVNGFVVNNVTLSNSTQTLSFMVGTTTIAMEPVLSVTSGQTTEGKYWLASDTYLYNNPNALPSLRALFTISTPSGIAPRARVALGENVETGLDNNQLPNTNIQKVLENGQLIIIRDGVKYNVQGQVIK